MFEFLERAVRGRETGQAIVDELCGRAPDGADRIRRAIERLADVGFLDPPRDTEPSDERDPPNDG